MFTCKPCLSKTNPALADNIPDDQYHTTTCDTCKKPKVECVQIAKEALRPKKDKPLDMKDEELYEGTYTDGYEKTGFVPDKTKPKKEKYQYLLIDWNVNPPNTYLATTRDKLLEAITYRRFTQHHTDLEVYKLTPLPHKAEIKVEVGKE